MCFPENNREAVVQRLVEHDAFKKISSFLTCVFFFMSALLIQVRCLQLVQAKIPSRTSSLLKPKTSKTFSCSDRSWENQSTSHCQWNHQQRPVLWASEDPSCSAVAKRREFGPSRHPPDNRTFPFFLWTGHDQQVQKKWMTWAKVTNCTTNIALQKPRL